MKRNKFIYAIMFVLFLQHPALMKRTSTYLLHKEAYALISVTAAYTIR